MFVIRLFGEVCNEMLHDSDFTSVSDGIGVSGVVLWLMIGETGGSHSVLLESPDDGLLWLPFF